MASIKSGKLSALSLDQKPASVKSETQLDTNSIVKTEQPEPDVASSNSDVSVKLEPDVSSSNNNVVAKAEEVVSSNVAVMAEEVISSNVTVKLEPEM